MRIVAPHGVFRPHSDTWMLAEVIAQEERIPGASVLDVCTGSGALAVAAGKAGATRVIAVDTSRKAVATVRVNGALNGVRVEAMRGDLFEPLDGRRVGAIVSNPPYLPSAHEGLPGRGPERAWEGGRDGRAVLDRIAADAPRHLEPGGVLLLVQSSVCGTDSTLQRLHQAGMTAAVVERRRGPLGRLLAARVEQLEARGVLRPGEREEDIVVIRAQASASGGSCRRSAHGA
jgi:release factor glutamine methyltransferase